MIDFKIQGKANRRKGHNFEREVAKDFREIGYPDAIRQLEYQEGLGVDLKNTGLFRIQCKNKKRYVNPDILNSQDWDGLPIVVTKANRKKPMAIMFWDDLREILKYYHSFTREI